MHKYPHEKVRHLAGKINAAGQVSALCFDPPKPIRLAVASWVAQGKHASCKKCLAILKERGIDPETFSVFGADGQRAAVQTKKVLRPADAERR